MSRRACPALALVLSAACSIRSSDDGRGGQDAGPAAAVLGMSPPSAAAVLGMSPPSAGAVLGMSPPSAPVARRMTVHFYDVGQGLAALVDLPEGGHVLVDTGDRPRRAGCGEVCVTADAHLVTRLREDLDGAPLDLVWITHQHSDHIGGVEEVLDAVSVHAYVDNGRDSAHAEVRRARRAAREHGATVGVVDPAHPGLPGVSLPGVRLTPIVPSRWPPSCARDANECSIGLRIDFGSSSVLFTGDAEHDEEAALDPLGAVTLLQVGHHGSETSSSPAFLSRVRPRYAVVSAGAPGDGLNRAYCHPRAAIIRRLTHVLGGPASSTLQAFDGERCDRARSDDWVSVPASDSLWATERDGDVVLTTTGNGIFRRQAAPARSAGGLPAGRF